MINAMEIYIAIFIFTLIATITYVTNRLNKDSQDLIETAESIVMTKLANRDVISAQKVVQQCSIPNDLQANAVAILNGLAKILRQGVNKLHADDLLSDVLQVKRSEFGSSYAKVWEKSGLKKHISVYSDDVFTFFETHTNAEKWSETWSSLESPPRNEDEWIDLIESMSVCDLLNYFAPMFEKKTV